MSDDLLLDLEQIIVDSKREIYLISKNINLSKDDANDLGIGSFSRGRILELRKTISRIEEIINDHR